MTRFFPKAFIGASAAALMAISDAGAGPACAGPADTAHVALRAAATWAACIERKIMDADLDADLVDVSAVAHIDSYFLRETGRSARAWTPLDAAAYRQLGLALVKSETHENRARLCANAKSLTLRFLVEPGKRPVRRERGA